MSDQNYSVFNAMVDIIAAPGKALVEIREHTAWLWWPLLLSLVVGIGATAYYIAWVDFDWLIEDTVRSLGPDAPPEAADQIRSFMSPAKSIAFGAAGIVAFTAVIYLAQSVYLHLATKLASDAEIRFGQWFAFSAWTGFVGIFNSLLVFGVVLTADSNQLPQQELMPLSMNQLFIHAAPGEPWFTWGNSLSLANLWIFALMCLGYARWTGASMMKSAIVVLLPWVALFGIWAALI